MNILDYEYVSHFQMDPITHKIVVISEGFEFAWNVPLLHQFIYAFVVALINLLFIAGVFWVFSKSKKKVFNE